MPSYMEKLRHMCKTQGSDFHNSFAHSVSITIHVNHKNKIWMVCASVKYIQKAWQNSILSTVPRQRLGWLCPFFIRSAQLWLSFKKKKITRVRTDTQSSSRNLDKCFAATVYLPRKIHVANGLLNLICPSTLYASKKHHKSFITYTILRTF